MNIASLLMEQVTTRPDAHAVIETRHGRSRAMTFAELDNASRRAAALLAGLGLREGDTILVFLPMSLDLYTALGAVFRLGLTAAFLDPSAGREHIARCCAQRPPKALLAGTMAHLFCMTVPALRRVPVRITCGLPLLRASRWESARGMAPCDRIAGVGPDTPALLTFTSGSTGAPKASVRTHGFLIAQHEALAAAIRLTPGEVDVTTLPIFGLANLASGVTTLIPDGDLRAPGSVDAGPILAQIRQWRPSRIGASPAFLERLADAALAGTAGLPELRHIYTGGAPVFPSVLNKLRAASPDAEITAVYGSTEAEPIATISHRCIGDADIDAMRSGRGLLVGSPVPSISLRIWPGDAAMAPGTYSLAEFESRCLPALQPGEIIVSGAHVLSADPNGQSGPSRAIVVDGASWLQTGDAGWLDERGRLWLLGRCTARIADEQGVIYPFSVECAADLYPSVRRSALVALGARRVLCVEPRPRAAPLDLEALKTELAWAHLHEVRAVRRIPVDRRHNAKIDYPALAKLLRIGDRP